jgi:hypothetical protein
MNKKTRKLKRTTQRGGFIVSPTNPYFMAVAAVIGGLYAYGRNQNSNTELTPAPDNNQAGGGKFRKTRKRKGGMEPSSPDSRKRGMEPSSPDSRKRKTNTREDKIAKINYINSLTIGNFNDDYFNGEIPPHKSLYRSLSNVSSIDFNKFTDGTRNISEHYKGWRANEAADRRKIRFNKKTQKGSDGTAEAAISAFDAISRDEREDVKIQREIDEEAAVEFERETFDMEEIPDTPVGVKYGYIGSVKPPNSGFTPDKKSKDSDNSKGDDLDLDSDGLDGLGFDFRSDVDKEVDNSPRGELFPGKGKRGGKRINKTRRRKSNKKKRTRRR